MRGQRQKAGHSNMNAMVLRGIVNLAENRNPLEPAVVPMPEPSDEDILIKVSACGVCHTELDEIEGRTPPPRFPVIPGHQVVGRVEKTGAQVTTFARGDRVGVGWIHRACGTCPQCMQGHENLCAHFQATGRDADGGYAEYMAVPEAFACRIPDAFSDTQAAPLLCAGAIGYRSLRLTGMKDGQTLGLTGFGASAHLVLKMALHTYPESTVFVFARNRRERDFAKELGAVWSGDTRETPPEKLDCIIDTTPAWRPVVEALKHLSSGGRLVINAIRKEDADKECLLEINYPSHLWMEKEIKSVANVSRRDVREFLDLAARIPIIPEVEEFDLSQANQALFELKQGTIRGAKVLRIHTGSEVAA